jgi:thymidylate synthase (FAD)
MKPHISIIARPNIDWPAINSFLNRKNTDWKRSEEATTAEELIEFAGRVCYMSFGNKQSPRTNEEYIKNLIMQGHESVIEHVNWTFGISNVTRSFTHQLVRHRIGFSYSQLSQQYVDHSNFEIHSPINIESLPKTTKAWEDAQETIRDIYTKIVESLEAELDIKKFQNKKEKSRLINSVARQILPSGTTTSLVMTANARALRHFLMLRGSTQGDMEMRSFSVALFDLLISEAPAVFFDFKKITLADGYEAIVKNE